MQLESSLAQALLGLTVAVAMALATPAARAERADREKPINLEADHMTIDDLKKIQVYEGKVVLVQGTLTIRAEKLVVTQDADGFSHGVATVPAGVPAAALASFRQKRDGADEYVEGWGERIEYDAKMDKAELFIRARLKRSQDEVRGNYISYNGKTEIYLVNSPDPASTSATTPASRVHVTMQPKSRDAAKDPAAAKPDTGLGLKPAGGIARPRED